ncbi:YfjI family protein [Pseudomonas aeruginosa]|uniref:YfjI family protein n=1 Tax=Pseudomonas aeruginosa TaxID=287 RepID=UPI00163A4681|nr:YfjI family protein [Pseudomonas aeruginosa]MBV6121144.1 DUF3987 domain-containing protein [Pseudomonas aeruginosa]MBV6133387.1 DUF3987 domain-containing protein [Pseudomonas aeruginosa]
MSWSVGVGSALPLPGSPLPTLEALPIFSRAITEGHSAIQVPLDMAVISGLGAMAAAVQGCCDVMAPFDKILPTALWLAGFAGSGERKDALHSYFFRGFTQLRKEVHHRYKEDHKSWRAKKAIWARRLRHLERKIDERLNAGMSTDEEEVQLASCLEQEPIEPVDCLLILEDATPAAVVEQVAQSGGHVAIVSAEGAAFLLGRASENLAFLNTAWSGTPTSIVRKTTGAIEVPEPRITILTLIQPSVMLEYMQKKGEKSRGIGLWARFLVCYPQSMLGHRDPGCCIPPSEAREAFAERIYGLAAESVSIARDTGRSRRVVRLGQAAELLWRDVAREIEVNLRPGGRFERAPDHASKLAENILRLAAVMHAFEGFEGDISLEVLKVAIGVCFHFSDEFLRLFCGPSQEEQDMYVLHAWLGCLCKDGRRYVKKNDVRRNIRGFLRQDKRMYRALAGLIHSGAVREFDAKGFHCLDLEPWLPFDAAAASYQIELPIFYFRGL